MNNKSMTLQKKLIISSALTVCVLVACIISLYFLISNNCGFGNEDSRGNGAVLDNANGQIDSDTSSTVSEEYKNQDDFISGNINEGSNATEDSIYNYVSSDGETDDEKAFVLSVPDNIVFHSPNILVYDLTEQRTVFSRIEYEICAPASLTKMLTALVALDYLPIDSTVRVGDEIDLIGENSSVAFLQKGSRYKMSTMLEALMLPSGNDAAYCLAVNAARAHANDSALEVEYAINDFVRLMNEKAKSLGCISSAFMSPDGYDAEGQYTTTEDMLLISIAAYNNSYIKECVSKTVNTQHGWYNSNMLIREDSDYYNPCVTGLKTGSTDDAGKCVAVSAEIGDHVYIMLFMKGNSSSGRFIDANTIINLVYEQREITRPGDESIDS